MSTATINKPGTLIRYRSRRWMVMPSSDEDLMVIKPLGGSEEEQTAIYLPLQIPGEAPEPDEFPEPTKAEMGAFETAKMIFDASRLSFRNASGPFRCMGKLSFRPRSYQIVPMVMALKQDIIRLLIADDVGIGKTIEALIILKEMLERGEIKKFAVICPPHLCEQWQQELKDKLDIDAEIIRSSTAAKLDRTIPDDNSVFHHVPYQVISIDYVKADKRRGIFLSDCPEFIIVDEAHTCAKPQGATSKNQQRRYALLYDLMQNKERHLLMLTATPHSGKDDEFLSILGLLKPEFEHLDFDNIDHNKRRYLSKFFIQRKRANIKRWLINGQNRQSTNFPERESREIGYALSLNYQDFFQQVLAFARGLSSAAEDSKKDHLLRSWAAIALIKGVMSSPAMAIAMLQNRSEKLLEDDLVDSIPEDRTELFGKMEAINDHVRQDLVDSIPLNAEEKEQISQLIKDAENLMGPEQDNKLQELILLIKNWVKEGFHPIVFCKYIATAKYVAEHLKAALPNKIHIEAITSELGDEQRKEHIDVMGESEQRVLIATDCLSEGINLQQNFNAVIHYDLPWNPNRIEQREGRVDRFGQTAEIVKAYMLYGKDNPMDEFIMEVLIRKVREIHRSTGVTISIGEDTENLMTQAAKKLLFGKLGDGKQQELFTKETVENELEKARLKGENIRTIFAHESVDPVKVQESLDEIDEAIGDIDTVETFCINALTHLGVNCQPLEKGFQINPQNLPAHLKNHFIKKGSTKISFDSPTPQGYRYIGRNHTFVEQLCQFMLALAFDGHTEYSRLARVSTIQTDKVNSITTLIMFRVRNVIKEVQSKKEVISEEMYLWGYSKKGEDHQYLDYTEAKALLKEAVSKQQLSEERINSAFERQAEGFEAIKDQFIAIAQDRAEKLVEAHGRFKDLVGGRRYEKATPVLPPDVMGIYVLLPKPKSL
jgi:ERCC4-related helicase